MTTRPNPLLVFANLTAERERRISEYQSLHGVERPEAAMVVDTEAPSTTNWEMLKMIGIDPGTADLWSIINGLACWNIYLHETNHLTDEALLNLLKTTILLETVTLIPPNADMEEHLGLHNFDNLPPVSKRDSSLPRPIPRPTPATN